jgi:ankyrin repeat protein
MLTSAIEARAPLALLKLLLDRGASPSPSTNPGDHPLYAAASAGERKTCEELLLRGAAVTQVTADDETALHGAAGAGHPDVCIYLIDAGIDPNCVDRYCNTPLHRAVSYWNPRMGLEVARALVAGGASPSFVPESQETTYLTPFQLAIKEGSLLVADFFIVECGEDPEQLTASGQTMADIACDDNTRRLLNVAMTEKFVAEALVDTSPPGPVAVLGRPSFGAL